MREGKRREEDQIGSSKVNPGHVSLKGRRGIAVVGIAEGRDKESGSRWWNRTTHVHTIPRENIHLFINSIHSYNHVMGGAGTTSIWDFLFSIGAE